MLWLDGPSNKPLNFSDVGSLCQSYSTSVEEISLENSLFVFHVVIKICTLLGNDNVIIDSLQSLWWPDSLGLVLFLASFWVFLDVHNGSALNLTGL